jgi:FAD:protein FMN transferase
MNYLTEVSRSFRAMNTGIEVVVCLPRDQKPEAEPALNMVQGLFAEVEKKLSRFRADSELSWLNQAAGQDFKASPLLYEIMTTAVSSARLTNGIFDPTILPYLESAGYNRSFEILKNTRHISPTTHHAPKHTWREIGLDPRTLSIFLPAGCSIDLGGIAKSWTADRAGRYLEKFHNYAIDAGGDIVVGGTQADGNPWKIGIEDPLNKKPNLVVLSLSGSAMCTSTTTKRKWMLNGIRQHHLIDPRTGAPSDSGVISATVIARTATLAETISKAALILGPRKGLQLIENQEGMQGILVTKNGKRFTSSNFPKIPQADRPIQSKTII